MKVDLVADRANGDVVTLDLLNRLRDAFPKGYVVGGFVRDALTSARRPSKDLDLVCTLADLQRARRYGVPGFDVNPNRYGNLKLGRGGLSVDLFAPESFYQGFPSLEEMLAFFDVSINAVAWPVEGGNIVDPLQAQRQIRHREFSLVAPRWKSTTISEAQAVLASRLLKLWRLYPDFRCVNPEVVNFDIAETMRAHPTVVSHHLGERDSDVVAELRELLFR